MATHGVHMVPMDREIYDHMVGNPNVDDCWSLVRERIGQLLFGEAYTTVPFLTCADYFNQFFIFTKNRTLVNTLMRRRPIYNMMGNIEFLIDRNRSTWFPQFDFSPWDINDATTMYRDYRFRLTSAPNAETPKFLEAVFRQPRARAVSLPSEQENVILTRNSSQKNDFRGIKHVYIITEVVLASYSHFLIRIGSQQTFAQYDRDIPIAFRYRKYKIRTDGTLVREVPTGLKYSDREVQWMRPSDLSIPRPQLSNRDKVERKNRTVLTVTRREAMTQSNDGNDTSAVRLNMTRFYQMRQPVPRAYVDEIARQQIVQALQFHLSNPQVAGRSPIRYPFRNANEANEHNEEDNGENGRNFIRSM